MYVCVYVYVYVCMYVCMSVCMCIYTHKHTHTHTHTHLARAVQSFRVAARDYFVSCAVYQQNRALHLFFFVTYTFYISATPFLGACCFDFFLFVQSEFQSELPSKNENKITENQQKPPSSYDEMNKIK